MYLDIQEALNTIRFTESRYTPEMVEYIWPFLSFDLQSNISLIPEKDLQFFIASKLRNTCSTLSLNELQSYYGEEDSIFNINCKILSYLYPQEFSFLRGILKFFRAQFSSRQIDLVTRKISRQLYAGNETLIKGILDHINNTESFQFNSSSLKIKMKAFSSESIVLVVDKFGD